jgi:hypothetical protein
MREGLDTDAGVQDFEMGGRVGDGNDCSPGCGWRKRLSIGACKVRKSRGMKLRLRRRIGFDKVLQCKRLAIVLGTGGLLAGVFTTTVRGGVGSQTEKKLRAGEAVAPEQCPQQQKSQERIGNGPHRNQIIAWC